MGDHDNPQKKRSIDEIIEHMTADIQTSDGQYIPLGFTPPPAHATVPHGWSEYAMPVSESNDNHSFSPHTPMTMNSGENNIFLNDVSGVHYEINTSHLPKLGSEIPQHHSFYYATAPRQQQLNTMGENHEIIGTMVDGGGNIVNVVYSGSNMSRQPYHVMAHDNREPMKHPIGGFIPYQSGNLGNSSNHLRDYGLFNSSDVQQQSPQSCRHQPQHFQGTVSNRAQLIENLVGNWVPNQSGTYSPFGCMDSGVRPVPSTNQQGIQTVRVPSDAEMEYKGVGRSVRKARIVAEVRPMRPTYSDVLAKSAPTTLPAVKPTSNNTNAASNKSEFTNPAKSKVCASKGGNGKKNSKSGILKRQHSSGSDEHNTNGNLNTSKLIQNPVLVQKSVGNVLKHYNSGIGFNSLPRKWVSLDDLDSDKQITGELGEEMFQSEDVVASRNLQSGSRNAVGEGGNKKSIAVPNLKSKCGQQGGVTTKRPPIHINNNLGTSTWGGAGTAAGGTGVGSIGTEEKNILKGSGGARICRNCPDDKKGSSEKPALSKRRGKKKECHSPLALFFHPVKRHVTHWGQIAVQIIFWFFHLLSDVLSMSVRLFAHLCAFIYDWLCTWTVHSWKKLSGAVLHLKVFEVLQFRAGWWNLWRRKEKSSTGGQTSSGSGDGVNFKNGFPCGLENNISLPSTGDEAMRRLLACKGKDPYSILGVTLHCTDDDIKKYYKRQAVLVHPDKNNQPGAEEAFKILVHAFELIGEPERRTAYDRRVAETQQVEQAWSELSDLLSQLHKKMEYAANTIRCTNCGKRHRRIHVNRPCYAARFCAQCKIHHNAKEGDIWAESSIFGFLWHYYACMDGGVYDITEWAACQADNLRHLRANTHIVQYRIVLGKQTQQQS
ncbi:DnaJ-like protein subfamily C member 14, partial [Zootermopsis nevadensis]